MSTGWKGQDGGPQPCPEAARQLHRLGTPEALSKGNLWVQHGAGLWTGLPACDVDCVCKRSSTVVGVGRGYRDIAPLPRGDKQQSITPLCSPLC